VLKCVAVGLQGTALHITLSFLLQCVEVCCSVLQCAAVYLRGTALHITLVIPVAVRCTVLHCVAVDLKGTAIHITLSFLLPCVVVCCSVFAGHGATNDSVIPVAVCSSVL